MAGKVLRFKRSIAALNEVTGLMKTFQPNGERKLNRTEWRGYPARSCAVTRIHGSGKGSSVGPAEIEVTVKPKGFISYTGQTRYDGWTAMKPANANTPRADGQVQEYTPVEVYGDVEFNELDFGEFIGETPLEDVKRTTRDAISEELLASGEFNASIDSTFVAPRRSRPSTKIILSNAPDGEAYGPGTRILNVSLSTTNLEQVLMDKLSALMADFMEGRASITNWSGKGLTFVALSDVLVDCEPNEFGEDSNFDILQNNVPLTFLDDLARRLTSLYQVQVEVVPGKGGGLVLRSDQKE